MRVLPKAGDLTLERPGVGSTDWTEPGHVRAGLAVSPTLAV